MTLAFHEMAHDEDDTGSHLHSVEFFQAYHDLTRGSALHWIADLAQKMRNQRWNDRSQELAEKEAKKEKQRDAKLGLAKARKVAADGLTHTPTKKVVVVKGKKEVCRRRRF